MVERYLLRLAQRLKRLTPQESAQFLQVAMTFKMPSIRQVTTWLQRPLLALTAEQTQFVAHLCEHAPDVRVVREIALAFRQLLPGRADVALSAWVGWAERQSVH